MKKNLAALIIIFIAGFALGWLMSWWLPSNVKILGRTGGVTGGQNIAGVELYNLRGQVSSVDGQNIKFEVKQLRDRAVVAVTKTAQVEPSTALYLITPKTSPEAGDEYIKQLTALKDKLKQAALAKNIKQATAIQEEIKALSLAHSAAISKQAGELNAKINALPADSAERREAERAYLELTSAFKYSIITLADIKTGDAIQAWSNDDLRTKDKFVATKVEIKR
jgi:hypothetical protein